MSFFNKLAVVVCSVCLFTFTLNTFAQNSAPSEDVVAVVSAGGGAWVAGADSPGVSRARRFLCDLQDVSEVEGDLGARGLSVL